MLGLHCPQQMIPLERHVKEALDRNEPILELVKWIEVCQILHYCRNRASSEINIFSEEVHNKTFNAKNSGCVVIGLSK